VFDVSTAVTGCGAVNCVEREIVHPLAPVAVTVYVPASKPEILWLCVPFDQVYETGLGTPLIATDAEPLLPPLHVGLTGVITPDIEHCKGLTVAKALLMHPFTSVTVTEY
jgi:hypothetical protein